MSRKNWKSFEGKKETFFEIDKGGRILRVRVHLKPQEKGNILWYLSTQTKTGHWSKFILKLDEMEELGFLLLLLSKFCAETMFLDKESFGEIQSLKQVWEKMRNPKDSGS